MALPLTVFKTFPVNTPASSTVVYTAPIGYNAIVLTAQAVNTSGSDQTFSMTLVRNSVAHPIVYNYTIPASEVLIASGGTAGKLVLQTGDSLSVSGSGTEVKFTLSVLETLV
jgi:hypothetical protein